MTVTLRPRQDGDLEMLYRLASDLDSWELRTGRAPTAVTRDVFVDRLSEYEGKDEDVVFVVDVDGTPVGQVTLFGFDELAHRAEFGISLVAEARGQGVGSEATRQILEFGFLRRNLHRITLGAVATNERALRVYRAAGFVQEGLLREHVWARGEWLDEVVMGLLRSDWLAARG